MYAYPGDGINGILGAFGRVGDGIDFVQVRHEEMAAFMACAHAKFTGEVGVCLATRGPGAIHLLNGLYDSKLDHQPVVAIVGQSARAAIGGDYQEEVSPGRPHDRGSSMPRSATREIVDASLSGSDCALGERP